MQKEIKVAVLPGDGIGPEVMEQALRVLEWVGRSYQVYFRTREALVGGAAFDEYKTHLPQHTIDICRDCQAILFGSVGGPVRESHRPKWKNCEVNSILALRKEFSFNSNWRPVVLYPQLVGASPLKPELLEEGIDFLIVRELCGDLYFGEHKREIVDGRRVATDVAVYDEDQIRSVAITAFEAARKRKGKVTSVDKANVLETSKLWREVVGEVAKDYRDVFVQDMLVDNCAMQILLDPGQFDVIVTSNMFGDILSDAAAALPGSLGMMPSSSFNVDGFALYEPAGGSAPDLEGRGIANPIGMILCVAMMLRFSFNMPEAAFAVEEAVRNALRAGYRTTDIYTSGSAMVGTSMMADSIMEALDGKLVGTQGSKQF
jgi:3-isopropylmalate dehydrogenase